MEEKKTIFNYLTQVMVIFGFSMLVLNVFCLAIGNSAKAVSAIFSLGNQGISAGITFQFLIVSAFIAGARVVFFTDWLIKEMPIWLRTVCMLLTVIAVIVLFVFMFHWFPVKEWSAWLLFFLCFGMSFLGSYLVMVVKEKTENRQLEEALRRLKAQEGEVK